MKKRKIFAVILAFVLMMAAFSGCGVIESLFGGEPPAQEQPGEPEEPQDPEDPPEEEPGDPEEPQQPLVTVMDAADRYAAEPVRNVMDDMTSYRDANYYYYIFYLGELNGVPLQEDAEAFQFNGNAYTYSFQKEKSSSGSIASSVKRAVEYCTSWTRNFQIGGSLSIKNIASIDLGYSKQWGESTRSSAEYSYEEAYSYAEKQVSSFSISFDDRYPSGYYRWIMFGDLDVYAAIEYDIRTGEYAVENYSVIAARYFTLDYSPSSGRFDDGEYEQLPFDMDASDVNRLPEPTVWISEEGVTGEGTQSSPYILKSADDFSFVRQNPDACYRLGANISFADAEFQPVPHFTGVFDGNGYTLSDISFTEDEFSAQTAVGLFAINEGSIFDLTVEDSALAASPAFSNKDVTVYAGAIAGINRGRIDGCKVRDVSVIANSSDIADRFRNTYFEDPRAIVQGSANWETWIRQRFYVQTNSWNGELTFSAAAGGVAGKNEETIMDCSVTRGSVEANVYNMQVPDPERFCQSCYAGGIAGYNAGGTVLDCTASAQQVEAWLEMSDDAAGMGWVANISPRGVCYAAGLAGMNEGGSVSGDAAGCTVKADARVYAAVYWFLQGAGYDTGNRANENRLTMGEFARYAPDGN